MLAKGIFQKAFESKCIQNNVPLPDVCELSINPAKDIFCIDTGKLKIESKISEDQIYRILQNHFISMLDEKYKEIKSIFLYCPMRKKDEVEYPPYLLDIVYVNLQNQINSKQFKI